MTLTTTIERMIDEQQRRYEGFPSRQDGGLGLGQGNRCAMPSSGIFGEASERHSEPRIAGRQVGRSVRGEIGAPAYNRLIDIWERWVRLHGPAAFLAHFSEYGVAHTQSKDPAIQLLLEAGRPAQLVAQRVVYGHHPRTKDAFWSRFPKCFGMTKQDIFVVYVRGHRHAFCGSERIKRLAELHLLYATMGISS